MTDHRRLDDMLRDAYSEASRYDWATDIDAARAGINRRRGEDVIRERVATGQLRLFIIRLRSSPRLVPMATAIAVAVVALAVPIASGTGDDANTALPRYQPSLPAEPSSTPEPTAPETVTTTPTVPSAPQASLMPPLRSPDAARAEPDITSDGRAVVLAPTTAGRCDSAVEGAALVDEHPYDVAGTVVAIVYVYYGEGRRQGCAKLVKPEGSPLLGRRTHLALTLCGDANSCDHDWNAYPTDAGPVVVPSQDGCVSFRVSILDETGNDWLVRDDIGFVGCD